MKVLITVKTHPIPSAKYDELVCTAGVQEDGSFVRLYPINFRDLPFDKQYRKYQWINIDAVPHGQHDVRKESFRPICETIQTLGEPIGTGPKKDWPERARFALARKSRSMEDLWEQQENDRTSLGVFRPRHIRNLLITPAEPDWKPEFEAALAQGRIWENRKNSLQPPRKVPFKFLYQFECDDDRCKKNHRMMIEDWEVGALYWRMIDQGATPDEAAQSVRHKFLDELCGPDKETSFFVGTLAKHPKSWVVIGVFYPKIGQSAGVRLDQFPLL